jgi:uncharacterized OsmC-like protein
MGATPVTTSYRVRGVSRPGGHGRIRCNATDVKADTGAISDGFRPGPAELLCASLAACLLKNIERYSDILPFEYETAAVEVVAQRQDAPPKMTGMRYEIEIVTSEPSHRVELLHRNIRKYGTIANTLAEACDLSGELIVKRPHQTSPPIGSTRSDHLSEEPPDHGHHDHVSDEDHQQAGFGQSAQDDELGEVGPGACDGERHDGTGPDPDGR